MPLTIRSVTEYRTHRSITEVRAHRSITERRTYRADGTGRLPERITWESGEPISLEAGDAYEWENADAV